MPDPAPRRVLRRTGQFKRDLKRSVKQGHALDRLAHVVARLLADQPLEARLRDHALVGAYQGTRECHLEPDWLLIYQETSDEGVLIRCGTHADLF